MQVHKVVVLFVNFLGSGNYFFDIPSSPVFPAEINSQCFSYVCQDLIVVVEQIQVLLQQGTRAPFQTLQYPRDRILPIQHLF